MAGLRSVCTYKQSDKVRVCAVTKQAHLERNYLLLDVKCWRQAVSVAGSSNTMPSAGVVGFSRTRRKKTLWAQSYNHTSNKSARVKAYQEPRRCI